MNHKNRKSPRLQNWDYGSNAAYFITICTKDREHYFGEIQNGKLMHSPAGSIAYVLWHEIKNHAKHVELGEFVVMPNHVHGILILNSNNNRRTGHGLSVADIGGRDVADIGGRDVADIDGTDVADIGGTDVACNVPTETEINPLKNQQMAGISPKSNTVSSIIRSYKSAVTKYCNRLKLPFAWQTRFHDHIIRNDESFKRISEYIKRNPANWREDTFY